LLIPKPRSKTEKPVIKPKNEALATSELMSILEFIM